MLWLLYAFTESIINSNPKKLIRPEMPGVTNQHTTISLIIRRLITRNPLTSPTPTTAPTME